MPAMTKRKQDHIDGYDPWEIEIAYCVNELEIKPIDARAIVIVSWMYRGDLRPLAAEIKKQGTALDGAILMFLARAIDQGLLTVKHGRGRPTQPVASVRDLLAAIRYENRDVKSADAIQKIANDLGMSDELVRRAIRRRRKITT
jgi:hypothetical protein